MVEMSEEPSPSSVDMDKTDVDTPEHNLGETVGSRGSGGENRHNGVNGDAAQHPQKRQSEESDWDTAWEVDDPEAEDNEALVLEDDPEDMASWSGQPSIKGGSEIMRMVLLTFNSIGMTFVPGSSLNRFALLLMRGVM